MGQLVQLFCSTFEEEVTCRKYFYKNSKLVKEGTLTSFLGGNLSSGIVRLSDSWDRELMNSSVELDRRMLDFIVGLETGTLKLLPYPTKSRIQ